MKRLLLALLLLLPGAAHATTCGSLPFIFVPGTLIQSAQVNSDFATLLNCANTLLAPLLSPTFTGVPRAPTASPGTTGTQIATLDFVIGAVSSLAAPLVGTGNLTTAVSIHIGNSNLATYNHETVYLNSAGVGGQTVTIDALSTLSDQQFAVQMCNKDSARWSLISADAGTMFAYPGTCYTLQSQTTAGKLVFNQQFQRYKIAAPTLYVAAPGSACSANNDGLAASRPLCIIGDVTNGAARRFKTDFDTQGTNPSIQLADGTYNTEAINITGYVGVGWGDGINILGNASTPANVKLLGNVGSTDSVVFVRDGSIVFLTNLLISCPAADTGPCISSSANASSDVAGVTFADATGQLVLDVTAGGQINLNGGNIIAGNAAGFFRVRGPWAFGAMINQTFTCTGAPVFTNFLTATGTGAVIDVTGSSFSGCGGLVGVRANIINGSELRGATCLTGSGTNLTNFTSVPGTANMGTDGVLGSFCD